MSVHDPSSSDPSDPSAPSAGRQVGRVLLAALLLAGATAGAWFAWLGWDDEYHLVDGVSQGPYRTWQVVGCALTVGLAAVAAQAWVRLRPAAPVLAAAGILGFAVPWAVHASSVDDSGLWVVGAGMLLLGGGAVLLVLLVLTAELTRPRRRRDVGRRDGASGQSEG